MLRTGKAQLKPACRFDTSPGSWCIPKGNSRSQYYYSTRQDNTHTPANYTRESVKPITWAVLGRNSSTSDWSFPNRFRMRPTGFCKNKRKMDIQLGIFRASETKNGIKCSLNEADIRTIAGLEGAGTPSVARRGHESTPKIIAHVAFNRCKPMTKAGRALETKQKRITMTVGATDKRNSHLIKEDLRRTQDMRGHIVVQARRGV